LRKNDGVAVASAGPYVNHLHLAPDNHNSTSTLSFYMLDALPATQQTLWKYWRSTGKSWSKFVTGWMPFPMLSIHCQWQLTKVSWSKHVSANHKNNTVELIYKLSTQLTILNIVWIIIQIHSLQW